MGADTHGRTARLELDDSALREWEAVVLAADPEEGIVLDRSAFYPGGGGQPPDHGVLLWGGVQTRIVDVRRGDDLWLLPEPGDPLPPVGTVVRGAVEDGRRTALMRTHSGLHLLSGVVFRDFGALVTGSNMDPLSGRLDFNLDEVPAGFKEAVEAACNVEVDQRSRDRRLRAAARAGPGHPRRHPHRDEPAAARRSRWSGSSTSPGLDVQADGGTHVASTRQIGAMRVVKVESKGKGFRRIRVSLEG